MIGFNCAYGLCQFQVWKFKHGIIPKPSALPDKPPQTFKLKRIQIIPSGIWNYKSRIVKDPTIGLKRLHLMKVKGDSFRLPTSANCPAYIFTSCCTNRRLTLGTSIKSTDFSPRENISTVHAIEGRVLLAISACTLRGSVRPSSCLGRKPVTRPLSSTPTSSHAGLPDERLARQTTASISSPSDRGGFSSPLNSTSNVSPESIIFCRISGVMIYSHTVAHHLAPASAGIRHLRTDSSDPLYLTSCHSYLAGSLTGSSSRGVELQWVTM